MKISKSSPGGFSVSHPRIILALFTLLILISGYFSFRFEIDASAETLLVKNNRLYLQSQQINQRFSPDEFILVAYEPVNGDIYSSDSMALLETLTARFLELDRVVNVTSILNVPILSQAPGLSDIDPQQWTWERQGYGSDQLRQAFTDHPIYTDLLVNEAQTATAVQIVFADDPELTMQEQEILALNLKALDEELSSDERETLEQLETRADEIRKRLQETRNREIDTIYSILDEHQAAGSFYLGGSYVLASHLVDIISSDLLVFGAGIACIIVVMLAVLFRDIRWVLLPVICCTGSVIITTGLFGLLGLKATVISSNFIALQLILTLALVIHLIVQYQNLAGKQESKDHHELLTETVASKLRPCFYAGLTTSVGFASLLFSNIQPVISFGLMMIIAMMISILVSLVLFPSVLALSRHKLPTTLHGFSESVVGFFYRCCKNHKAGIVFGSVLFFLVSVSGIAFLKVENSFINYFRQSTQVHQELTFIDREMGGTTPLDIVYTPEAQDDSPELILTAEQVQTMQRIQSSLQSGEAVGKVMSVVNFTELARELNDDVPLTEYELSTIYTLLDNDLKSRLLGSYFHEESGQFRINARIKDSTENLSRQDLLNQVRQMLDAVGARDEQVELGNLFVLYQDILQRLFKSQILTIGLVYLFLMLVLCAIFRSFTVAAVSITPNIIATLSILGIMGWFGIPLDLMTITITAIAMGIAVDDTIHFVHHYLKAKRTDSDCAMHEAFSGVGYALLYTSLIIALGFSILMFSDFVPSVVFGLLTCLAMLIALLTDMTLLPVLLEKFVKRVNKS